MFEELADVFGCLLILPVTKPEPDEEEMEGLAERVKLVGIRVKLVGG